MPLSYIHRSSRMTNFVVAVCLIAVFILSAFWVVDTDNKQQEAQRQRVAQHWAQAGLVNPVTTLKDGGNKTTTGSVEACAVTVEGFTTYTTVVIKSKQGNPAMRQELTFFPGDGQVNPDQAAFNYIKSKLGSELAGYCTTG